MKRKSAVVLLLFAAVVAGSVRSLPGAETRISIGVTETMETFIPTATASL